MISGAIRTEREANRSKSLPTLSLESLDSGLPFESLASGSAQAHCVMQYDSEDSIEDAN